jgi:hypothetical protein
LELIETVKHQIDLFPAGSAQHTLQVNRLKALMVAQKVDQGEPVLSEELNHAVIPLGSLISKSEKALLKLKPESWQAQRMVRLLATLKPIHALIRGLLDAEQENPS